MYCTGEYLFNDNYEFEHILSTLCQLAHLSPNKPCVTVYYNSHFKNERAEV